MPCPAIRSTASLAVASAMIGMPQQEREAGRLLAREPEQHARRRSSSPSARRPGSAAKPCAKPMTPSASTAGRARRATSSARLRAVDQPRRRPATAVVMQEPDRRRAVARRGQRLDDVARARARSRALGPAVPTSDQHDESPVDASRSPVRRQQRRERGATTSRRKYGERSRAACRACSMTSKRPRFGSQPNSDGTQGEVTVGRDRAGTR